MAADKLTPPLVHAEGGVRIFAPLHQPVLGEIIGRPL